MRKRRQPRAGNKGERDWDKTKNAIYKDKETIAVMNDFLADMKKPAERTKTYVRWTSMKEKQLSSSVFIHVFCTKLTQIFKKKDSLEVKKCSYQGYFKDGL